LIVKKIFCVLLLSICLIANAATVKEFFPKGYIDWTTGHINIMARSQGLSGKVSFKENRQKAFDEVSTDFFLKASELIMGVRVDNQLLAENLLSGSEVLSAEIERIIRQARIRKLQERLDGTVIIDAYLPLYGSQGVGAALLSSKMGAPVVNEPPEETVFFNIPDDGLQSPEGAYYTGLIVDAGMVALKPALLPKIYDRKGNLLYGSNHSAGIDFAAENGLASYVYTLEDARKLHSRIGGNPLIVKAMDVKGSFQTDVVLFRRDAARLVKANRVINFLKQAGVVFIIRK
ncbi:hypothetical protein ACFL57_04655, partial [Candidatus Margulisiibacteriota bacterium]